MNCRNAAAVLWGFQLMKSLGSADGLAGGETWVEHWNIPFLPNGFEKL